VSCRPPHGGPAHVIIRGAAEFKQKIFFTPFFSLLYLKRCDNLAKLQNGSQFSNCIESDLFIF